MKKLAMFFAVVFVMLSTAGCGQINGSGVSEILTIQDLSYDRNPNGGYTVYLQEDGEWIPYLVLSGDYGGNTLLLRRDLLDELHFFEDSASASHPHYENSKIDIFLSDDFLSSLSEVIKAYVLDSPITVTSADEKNMPEILKEIDRKVFLLSYTEIGFRKISTAHIEGKTLKYFSDGNSVIANINGKPTTYWLRTFYLGTSSYGVWTVQSNGKPGYSVPSHIFQEGAHGPRGVRPAFCVQNDLVVEKTNIIAGQDEVYIFSAEKIYLEE